MKLIFAALMFVTLRAHAQTAGQPFQLPEGEYTLECVSDWVAISANSNGQIDRAHDLSEGKTVIQKEGNQVIETFTEETPEIVSTSVTKTTTVDLGSGVFEQTVEATVNNRQKASGEVITQKLAWVQHVKVKGFQTINLIERKAGVERPLVGESYWWEKPNHQIVQSSYLREKSVRPHSTELVSNSVCTYTRIGNPAH